MNISKLFFTTLTLAATAIAINAQLAALKRGDALVAQEQYQQAIAAYSEVTPADRDSYARAIYNIGVCHYELWQTGEAIAFYKRAIELKQGNYPRASYALGVALEDQGNTTDARAAYEEAARGEFAPATYRLGLLAAKAGEFKKAAALFREAAARTGAHVPASHNNLGVMFAQLGMMKEAEQEFVTALRKANGSFADAAHNLNLCRSLTAGVRQDWRLHKLGAI